MGRCHVYEEGALICRNMFYNILHARVQDPDRTTVDIVEMVDVNNGIPSLQNPFKIPVNPK